MLICIFFSLITSISIIIITHCTYNYLIHNFTTHKLKNTYTNTLQKQDTDLPNNNENELSLKSELEDFLNNLKNTKLNTEKT